MRSIAPLSFILLCHQKEDGGEKKLLGSYTEQECISTVRQQHQLQMGQQCHDPPCITNKQKIIHAMQDIKRNYGTVVTNTEDVTLMMQRKKSH